MINSVAAQSPFQMLPAQTNTPIKNSGSESFGTLLKDAIDSVNQSQVVADQATQKLVNGEDIDLHEVMITSQKASITLQTAVEVRNKMIEAYQEVMRMQV